MMSQKGDHKLDRIHADDFISTAIIDAECDAINREKRVARREYAVTTEESALPYIVTAASKSEAREAIESQHLRVLWVEHRRSQCDKCKVWGQAHTMKTQAGVTFCAACQSSFIDWIGQSSPLRNL